MKTVTDNFKSDIRTYGRQLDFEVINNNIKIDNDEINSLKPSFNTKLFKTVLQKLEIDAKNEMLKKSKINLKAGVKLNGDYEYISYNTYQVEKCERQEDTNSYIITAYDKMIESMIDYDLTYTEKITVRQYLIKICERLGWNTNNIPASFINSEKLVSPALHMGIGYTFRDALDEIATITCSFLYFVDEDFYLAYPTETNESIDESYLDEDNITIGEKYFINSLVFSRAEESDNIYRKNDSSISINGLHEFRISDNQLLSTNERDLYIDEMFYYLQGFEFYVFDVKSKGILFLEACDKFIFILGGKEYPTILLNNEITFEDGITEDLYTDQPEETETEYKYADSTDRKINQTYIIVDKQNQIIESVVSNVSEQNNKISKVQQTVDSLNSKISDIADITISQESNKGTLNFEKINQSEPIHIEIKPLGESISYLYPFEKLFPSDNLFIKLRTLRFTNTETEEIFDYELPDDLLYYDSEHYDEFILDYESQTCYVNKKCKYNSDGDVVLLENEVVKEFEFPHINLTDGDYKVEILKYDGVPYIAYLFARLMTQNMYTTQFAIKAEVKSEINQTANDITLSVDKKLSNYSTTSEMNSAIAIKANEITSTVSNTYATKDNLKDYSTTTQMNSAINQKADSITSTVSATYETKTNASNTYATKTQLSTAKSEIKQTTDNISLTVSKKVGNDEVISKINQSSEAVTINANKISLSGKTINLTSDNMAIQSTNFSVDKNGKMTCSSANINGGQIDLIKTGTYAFRYFNDSSKNTGYMLYISSDILGINNGNDHIEVGCQGYPSIDVYRSGSSGTYIKYNGISTPSLSQTSKEEDKKNFEKLENGLEILKDIDIYKYNLKSENDNTKKHIGFVIGENYNYREEVTSNENNGVDLYSFVSLCCKAIQEQQQEIEELKKRLEEIK